MVKSEVQSMMAEEEKLETKLKKLKQEKRDHMAELERKIKEKEKIENETKEFLKERALQIEKEKYTPNRKELSDLIRFYVQEFHKRSYDVSSIFITDDFEYVYFESYGTVTIHIKSNAGIKKTFLKISRFQPDIEIKVKRDFKGEKGKHFSTVRRPDLFGISSSSECDGDYNYIADYFKNYEENEEEEGYKLIPEMKIKTFSDLDYNSSKWHNVSDTKLEHYLTIIKNDLNFWIDQQIIEIQKKRKKTNET